MRFFGDTKIDFIGKRKTAFIISGIIILAGIISLVISGGPKYSIDFTGGSSIILDLNPNNSPQPPVKVQELRDVLAKEGYPDAEIQNITEEGKIYYRITNKEVYKKDADTESADFNAIKGDKIVNAVKQHFPNYVHSELIRSKDDVGPRIGEELKTKAILAIFYALLGIIVYIWWRFQFTFGVAAIIALAHDVLITVGIFSIAGKEISLAIVAALLTIVGYSLNDTIVVFDRIREDLKVYRRESYQSIINHSINETLNRTVITSLTTFFVALVLYIVGGSVIHDFAFAILVGVLVGTYSSIFIASPVLVEHFLRVQKKKGIKRGK